MSRVIYEELQDKEGNVHYLHTEDKVVFDENGQSLRAAMKEVQFEDYTGTAELPSVETAMAGITRGRKWTDLFGNIKAALKGLKAKDEAIEGSMGDAFSEEKSYAVGDYAIYKDVLYKFTAAKTAGSWDAAKVRAVTVVGEVCSLNANIGKKQDASTAITTGNIGQQSVKHATTAGSSSAVAWGNVSGKPGTYPPSGHNHDDRYYTETEANNLLGGRARIVRQSWGKSLSIQMPHGIIIDNYYNAYIIWVAGNPGNYQYQKNNFAGEDSLNFSVNANTGVLSVSSKNNTDTAITYIGA